MKRALGLALAVSVVCIGVGLVLRRTPQQEGQRRPSAVTPSSTVTQPVTQPVQTMDEALTLQVLMADGTVEAMSLSQYLPGVLLAEMPASFEREARMAQAVVSRTYALHRRSTGKHEGADVCASASCCQAWTDPSGYPQESVQGAREAVLETDGLVLVYEGRLIDATFFSSSGGRTEAAVAVWGSDVPYLQAVDSPGEEVPDHEDTVTFSVEEFAALIQGAAPAADLTGLPAEWFGDVTYTDGGGVDRMEIGGTAFSGKTLRGLLGLRSTSFTVKVDGDLIQIQTQGYGHRVGMSQYGAQAMAQEGKTFSEILIHYYTGVSLNYYIEAEDFSQ